MRPAWLAAAALCKDRRNGGFLHDGLRCAVPFGHFALMVGAQLCLHVRAEVASLEASCA